MGPNSGVTELCLLVEDCVAAVDFYTAAFGGRETMRECLLDGHVLHAEIAVSCYRIRLSERPVPLAAGDDFAAGGADDCPGNAADDMTAAGPVAALQDPFGYRWSLRFVATAS